MTVTALGTNQPASTVVGAGGRVPPTAVIEDATAVETSGVFDQATDCIEDSSDVDEGEIW